MSFSSDSPDCNDLLLWTKPMTPAAAGFRMPPEWERHQRTWIAWPVRSELWGSFLEQARREYSDVCKTILRFEPVTLVISPRHAGDLHRFFPADEPMPEILVAEHDDSWLRDNGPMFIRSSSGELAAVKWRFNGWGGKYRPYDDDARIPSRIADALDIPLYEAPIVLEGGAFSVDDAGTLLVAEQCVLNPNRNPTLGRSEAEDTLMEYTGAKKVIWVPYGLVHDETDGHVDNVAVFVAPSTVLVAVTDDRDDPDFHRLKANFEMLSQERDAAGKPLQLISVPKISDSSIEGGWPSLRSYVNLYHVNGAIIVPRFDAVEDDVTARKLSRIWPDKDIVGTSALCITRGGGGVHCITQQQP